MENVQSVRDEADRTEKSMVGLRESLAALLASEKYVSAKEIAGTVNDLAEMQGKYRALIQFRDVAERTGSVDKAMMYVHRTLTNGADDSWSGRRNDVARADFDGYRKAASDLQWVKA